LERIWKEAFMVDFKVLSRHLPGGIEENHETPQSGYPVSDARFESRIFISRSGRNANHSALLFGV
jgi:hypothetical protein